MLDDTLDKMLPASPLVADSPTPPLPPPRSPLRPLARSISLQSSSDIMRERHNSMPAVNDVLADESPPPTAPPTMTKRQHALHELLSSERAYASDLALIREVHIPLALGQTPPLNLNLPASGSSSSSSSRTLSTASDSSGASNPSTTPPMTPEDVKIIFGNVTELAAFSDLLSDELQLALGNTIDGGQGDDRVGELFLTIIPQLEKPFKQYITRHSNALAHLQNLPQTPELSHYLAYTQTIASSLSHAWDIASLLIKPVQRLLKYPLLLSAIIDETPDAHPDKENLRLARTRMEEVARNVNEGRRRAEVIKDVLSGGKNKKSPNVGVTVSAGVNLSKMKSLRHGGVTAATVKADLAAAASSSSLHVGSAIALNSGIAGGALGEDGNGASGHHSHEAAQVEALQAELKRIDGFAQQFAKNVVEYSKSMFHLMHALRQWALAFGRVIGLSADQGSEAFDAFVEVIEKQLMPLAVDLEGVINERLLKETAYLLGTMTQPLKLLASMNEQEPFHYHLLTMPISAKNKPPPSLLAASTNYLALRGQLAAELPEYIRLLHRGLASIVRRLAEIQRRFWRDVRDRWGELWEMLRVEGEWNAGFEETIAVWSTRWRDVDEVVRSLGVCRPPPPSATITPGKSARRGSMDYVPSPAPSFQAFNPYAGQIPVPGSNPKLEKRHSQKKNSTPNVNTVTSMFASLEPSHSPRAKPPPSSINVTHTLGSLEPSLSSSGSQQHLPGGVSGSGASIYSTSSYFPPGYNGTQGVVVSGPLPLQQKNKSRARGGSDAADSASVTTNTTSTSSRDGHNRRGSSQDGPIPRRRESLSKSDAKIHQQRRRTGPLTSGEEIEYIPALDAYGYSHGQLGPLGYMVPGAYPQPPPTAPVAHQSAPQSRLGIPRMKSMPLSSQHSSGSDKASVMTMVPATGPSTPAGGGKVPAHAVVVHPKDLERLPLVNGGGYAVEGDYVYYLPPGMSGYPGREPEEGEEWIAEAFLEQEKVRERDDKERDRLRSSTSSTRREKEREREKERGRDRDRDLAHPNGGRGAGHVTSGSGQFRSSNGTSSAKKGSPSPKPKSKERPEKEREGKDRPTHARKRSGSIKSITSIFTSSNSRDNGSIRDSGDFIPPTPSPPHHANSTSQRDSWVSRPAKYICQVVHPCKPPAAVSYFSFPFFTLVAGELFEVLQEAGHPSLHPKLPLYVDDGEDCLLLCRDGRGMVGWALASFLEPVNLDLN